MRYKIRLKGGPGSGHFGHSGRPGKVGGSSPGTGGIGGRYAVGKPGNLDTILTRDGNLSGIEWGQIVDARAQYAEYLDRIYGDEPGTTLEHSKEYATWRNERLGGTESYEESLAMAIRKDVQDGTGSGFSENQATDLKITVAETIAQDIGADPGTVYEYIDDWNGSAWGDKSRAFQRIAWEWSDREDLPTEDMKRGVDRWVSNWERDMFDSIYNETQAQFKAAGVKTVTLYRGIQLAKQDYPEMAASASGVVSFRQGPLSSWSFDPYMATCFGNCAMSVEVPVERIWSTGFSGPGTFGEFEAILFEGIGDDEVSYKWQH